MDLSGTWLAMGADEGLRRRYPEPDFDDSWWAEIEVPGHWRSNPAFAGHDGPLLYRRRFEAQLIAEVLVAMPVHLALEGFAAVRTVPWRAVHQVAVVNGGGRGEELHESLLQLWRRAANEALVRASSLDALRSQPPTAQFQNRGGS